MSAVEAPHWDEQETRQRLSMYNSRTLCIDRVAFSDQNSAIAHFVLRPEAFPPQNRHFKPEMVLSTVSDPFTGEIQVTESLVYGHFTLGFGISVVRGIDQIAAALDVQRNNIKVDYSKDAKARRIKGPVKFSQPVVVGDKMYVRLANLKENGLVGDSNIEVDKSIVTSIEGIEFELVEQGEYGRHVQGEAVKAVLIEAGAQTAVADFLYRRDSQSLAEQAKGDFLVYAGIRGPIEFYEDILPGGIAEVHMVKDSQNPQVADVTIWVEGRKVAEIFGNECAVGNRERTRQLIERVVARRRARVSQS